MRTRVKGTSRAAVLAAGFVALGVTAIPSSASADVTTGAGGVLSGNQIGAPVSAPVEVSGNAASLLGVAHATFNGGAKVRKHGGGGQKTSGAHGVASGNQVNAPISVPVNVCGNSVGVLGHAHADCKGGAKVKGGGKHGRQVTGGAGGVLAGNQVNAPISIPVDICGNAVALAGLASALCHDDHGGYHPYYRTTGTRHQPAVPHLDGVPATGDLSGLTALPATSGLPKVGVAPASDARTGEADLVMSEVDGLPKTGGLSGLPLASAVSEVDGTSVTGARSKAVGLPSTTVLPALPGLSNLSLPPVTSALPASGARSKVGGGLSDGVANLPTGEGLTELDDVAEADDRAALTRNGLPRLGNLISPNALPLDGAEVTGLAGARHGARPVTDGGQIGGVSVLDTWGLGGVRSPKVPGVAGGAVLPSSPVVPSLRNTGLPSGDVVGTVPVPGEIGPVKHVAAEEAIVPGNKAGATWTFGAAAFLAFVAGGLGLSRRFGLGRR